VLQVRIRSKYEFDRQAARSVAMMSVCGQPTALGLSLIRLGRGAADSRGVVLV